MNRIASLLVFSFLLFFHFSRAQDNDTNHLQISMLTCSPGEELYSLFGHSAIRIVDSSRGTDVIFNWGTFDFDEPNFYLKFMRGKLLYFVSADNLQDFLYEYQYEGRSVTEQVLNLTLPEKIKIRHAVDSNMEGNNRFYRYDFVYDNCTTRIRDLIFNYVSGIHVSGQIVPPGTTFRNMIHHYLDHGGQPWSKLGIDILLGAKIDQPVTDNQAMFLPEYLMKAVDSSESPNGKLCESKKLILPRQTNGEVSGVYTPLILLTFLCAFLFVVHRLKTGWAKVLSRITDSFLLYITGIVGLLMVFMWFFTDHTACADNYNLLWAVPFNLIAAFLNRSKHRWLKTYFLILSIITALTLLTWFWLPQQLNIALIPVLLLLLYRYIIFYAADNTDARLYKRIVGYGEKVSSQ